VSEQKPRVLIAKPGLDGHDVGAKVIARALSEAGCEVIYTGLRRSLDEIANEAQAHAVDVIGLSILSGSHLELCRRFAALRVERGLERAKWVVGGVIPEGDRAALAALGVDRVFGFGSRLEEIVSYIQECR
jgi:methylmalonyl-CoA mutase C-terminal domain/subunit